MNSENFMIQNSLEANYLNIRLDPGDRLDEIAVKVIQKDCPDFLIPFRIVSVNEEIGLKYKLINTVALEYAEMTLPKALFVQLYLNLLEPFVKGRDWFLDYHNFCVDTRYVYVDKHSYQVFYLYVPVRSFHSADQEILEYFKNVFMSIMISDDKDFQVRLFRFFGSGHVTLAGLYQLMLEEKSAGASQQPMNHPAAFQRPVLQQSVSQQPVFSQSVNPVEEKNRDNADSRRKDKRQVSDKDTESRQEITGYGADHSEEEVVQALFGSKKSKKEKNLAGSKKSEKDSGKKKSDEKGHGGLGSLFGGKKKQAVQPSQEPEHAAEANVQAAYAGGQHMDSMDYGSEAADYASMYGGIGAGSDETEVFSDEAVAAGSQWLELIDLSQPGAPQRIDLNFTKPYITVGRMSSDEKRPDVAFPGEFKRIGRQHARIERRGDAFFVIDLGSANHTMVNGQVIAPNQPYQLWDGMELAFTVSKPVRYRVHIS